MQMRVSVSVLQIICLCMQMLKKTPKYCHCLPSSTVLHTLARDNIPALLFCRSVSAAIASATVTAVATVITTTSSAIAAAIAAIPVVFIRRLTPPPLPTLVGFVGCRRPQF